jgi:hypothetical protein
MALGKSVLIGLVASLAVPFVLSNNAGQLSEWVRRGLVDFELGGEKIGWSLPIFAGVTLLAWLLLLWSEK